MDNILNTLDDFTSDIFTSQKGPHVSIYLSTHKHHPENEQDRIRYKNLVTEVEKSLAESYSRREYDGLLSKLTELLEPTNTDFWRFASEGLAVLVDSDDRYLYRLNYAVKDTAIAADSFHIKPLIRNFQYETHYYLLALTADSYQLYYSNYYSLEKVNVPQEIVDRFDGKYSTAETSTNLNVGSYGGLNPSYHGHYTTRDIADKETEQYFRFVDKVVTEFTKEDSCPILLVSLPEHQALFRSFADVPHLKQQSIEKSFDSMSEEEVLGQANDIMNKLEDGHIKSLLKEYDLAASQEKGSSDTSTIASAMAQAKVKDLFVDLEKNVPGTYNEETGSISFSNIDDPFVDDLIDDLAQETYRQGGSVYAVEAEDMPSDSGIAAIYRY